MILDTTRPRRALSHRALLLALGLSAAALIPLAVLRPGARAQAAVPAAASHHLTTMTVTPATPAAFASGVPVQFAGVGNPQTLKWWSRNGAPLVRPVYGISPFLSSGELPAPRQRQVQLAFRLPPAAQDVTVRYALTGSLNSSSGGSWPSKIEDHDRQTEAQLNAQTNGARVVTATFPASVSKTDVRVGVASGPWKVIGIARRDVPEQIEGLSINLRNALYIVSRPAETKEGAVVTVSVNTAAGSPAEDLRLIAVDVQDHQLLPVAIGDSSIGALDQITARFALPPAQIRELRLESRPFRYVEFKNVALRPLQ